MSFKNASEILNYLEEIGLTTLDALKNRLDATVATLFPVLATIKTGDGRKTADFLKSLKQRGFKVGKWAEDVMKQNDFKNSVSNKEDEFELCPATVKELTGNDVATLRDILAAVIKKGYDKCMPEDGPRLREAYSGTDTLFLAMDPIRGSDGDPLIFYVDGNDDDLWLAADDRNLDYEWSGGDRFVFRRRKTS